MSAIDDADSGSVTVTCQASLGELRSAALWLYLHDRAAQFGILLVVLGGIGIFVISSLLMTHAGALAEHPNWMVGRGVGATIWLIAFVVRRAWLLWTLPVRAWQRMQREGRTTLTVSATGLSWHNSARRSETGWVQYAGYALLPEVLLLLSSAPYIVPRSTVRPTDFERVVAIAKEHLEAVSHFDSQQKWASPAA